MQVRYQTVEHLVNHGCLYIPVEKKDYILKVYGRQTLHDFDTLWGFNEKMGNLYPTGFQTMIYSMNEFAKDEDSFEQHMQDQFKKLQGTGIAARQLRDMFNIIQSCIRTRLNEKVWYV